MKNQKNKALYRDASQNIDLRVKDLLERMTLEEKVRQTGFIKGVTLLNNNTLDSQLLDENFDTRGIGGLMDPWLPAVKTASLTNAVQKYLRENTRLGIPALFMCECLHGHLSPGATIFPQAIGLACSGNLELIEEIAAATAKEARSVGLHQALSPNLDLARDSRWGRVEETFGEDTCLCSKSGVSYIHGLQGKSLILDPDKLIATPKHFAAHCAPQGGINIGPADVGIRKLREEYLPPFKAAVDAGVLSIMPAYNEVDGIPCSASTFLLRQILRDEWGFKGYVFSDFSAIEMLCDCFHKVAENFQQAGKRAFLAGVDMEAANELCYAGNLLELLQKEEIPIARLDEAVGAILKVKFLLGLFENPYVDENKCKTIVNCKEHIELARKAAQESIVLLKNSEALLPLNKNISSIAVIGPNSSIAECGVYCIPKADDVSPLEGIRCAVSKETRIFHAEGCDIHDLDKNGFEQAVKLASRAEVAVICVGGSSMSLGGVGWEIDGKSTRKSTCGEGYDRTDLNLSGVQQELVEAIVATGTPTVVILINGRPLSIGWIDEHVPAILEAWYPGEQGGHALADILFGKFNPSAKLSISFPRNVGQIPKYYSQKPSARGVYKEPGYPGKPGRDYVYCSPSPLYEFGHGLSYTSFTYSDLNIKQISNSKDILAEVSVTVHNNGCYDGTEIVQLYINDVVSSVTTPCKILKHFERISLDVGERKTITFKLSPDDLSLLNENMKRVVESGEFEVMIADLKEHFKVI